MIYARISSLLEDRPHNMTKSRPHFRINSLISKLSFPLARKDEKRHMKPEDTAFWKTRSPDIEPDAPDFGSENRDRVVRERERAI
jgi:hypothetical protein